MPLSRAAVGYACTPSPGVRAASDVHWQRAAIEVACTRSGLELVELVGDRAPRFGKGLERPGIAHALRRLAAGDASCLVVARIDHLSESLAELAELLDWLDDLELRLVSLDPPLDTGTEAGAAAARVIAVVGGRERERLAERTRAGLDAARAKRGAADGADATVRRRIAAMREDGMTLQAIADVLNAEGVPTQRGGTRWRPSSVHGAAGYRRPSGGRPGVRLPAVAARRARDSGSDAA